MSIGVHPKDLKILGQTTIRVHPKDLKILCQTQEVYIYAFSFYVPTKEIDPELGSSGYTKVFVDSKKNYVEIDNVYNQLEELLNNPYLINPSIEMSYMYDSIIRGIRVTNIILPNEKLPSKK